VPVRIRSGSRLAWLERRAQDDVEFHPAHARFLCTKLRARFPKLKIIVGLWGATERVAEASKRLQDSGASGTVTSLAGAMQEITALAAAREPLESVTAA
jgi:hypothetical protein